MLFPLRQELFVFDWAANQMVDQGLVKVWLIRLKPAHFGSLGVCPARHVKTLHNLLIHKWVDEDLQQDLGALTEQLNDRVAALMSVCALLL